MRQVVSNLVTWRLLAAVTLVFGGDLRASAQDRTPQGRLVVPAAIILYVHARVRHTEFVQPLVCALQRVLAIPVSTQASELPLGSELLATPTQLDVEKVADRFIRATATDGSSLSFKYLILSQDLKVDPLRYVFATSFGNDHVGIVSIARLQVETIKRTDPRAIDITVTRAYKLILKSIARLAGLNSPDACILAFPRNIDELDQKSSEFCPNDHATLVSAGILKAEPGAEGAGCIAISQEAPRGQRQQTTLAAD